MQNILLTGSNGFVGSYFKDNYKNKYNINTFSFLNDDFQNLDLQNILKFQECPLLSRL